MLAPSWLVLILCIVVLPLVAIGGFAGWVARRPDLSFDEKIKAWGVLATILSSLTVIVGGGMVVAKYAEDQARNQASELRVQQQEANQRAQEFTRQTINGMQTEHDRVQRLYDETMSAASRLATESSLQQIRRGAHRIAYEEMYWAKLIGIESADVESAMVHFRQLLERWSEEHRKPESELNSALLLLSKKCREHLKELREGIQETQARAAGIVVALDEAAAATEGSRRSQ